MGHVLEYIVKLYIQKPPQPEYELHPKDLANLKKDVYKGDCDRIKELEGRFCFDMNKYKISLELFSKDILSEKGYELYNIFLAKYHEIINSNSNLINKYNLDNQTYMFSFEKFCQSNLY